ncbi:MAG: cupin-like domain-containing protein [Cyclobacteriaceae bacterium]|nr:cupin-like domain-containing protein [Cyclobacteriaceae bacterium]UYN87770.1 MAG: cupin-like domain-containing protein [Cyclobacteriaceae bacterium]
MPLDIKTPVPVVDGTTITREEFQREFYKPQKPVVLRGLWKQYPAYTKWTMDFFKESMGNIEVGLYGNRKEDLSKTLQVPNAVMRFDEYLNLIEREPTDLRLFLFPVFKHKPELLKDFDYPKIASGYIKIPFMFFGPANSIVRMHQDIDMSNVFLTQFHGRKRVVLFAPDQSELLYRLPFNVHSTVDVDRPDYDSYPGLNYVKGMSTVIEHGDTIFMPSGYWHHIEYMEGGFGLSVRTLPYGLSMKARGLWNLTVQRTTDNIMRKLNDEKWFAFKKKLAHKRADKIIQGLSLA